MWKKAKIYACPDLLEEGRVILLPPFRKNDRQKAW